MTNDERMTYIAGVAVGAAIIAGALILIEARKHPCDCHEHADDELHEKGDGAADVEHASAVAGGGLPLGVVTNGARAVQFPEPPAAGE